MALFTASLNSGSNGNCYYIANEQEAVLIDAGISCREIEKRMKRLGLSLQKLKAIFISHEHSDHINGAEVLSKRYQIPVYINEATYAGSRLAIESHLRFNLDPHQPVVVGDLTVTPFPKRHDAADPLSFNVSGDGVHIGVMTDIGSVCDDVVNYFRQCHAVYLEANYDDEMLDKGHYPYHLKQRIKSTHGHLSNHQALELFLDHRPPFLGHVFLSHLSRENNSPRKAVALFSTYAANTAIIHASRECETAIYQITPDFLLDPSISSKPVFEKKAEQLKLF
jgi:phosphoribosyl 1,2-cyclic phosphodiesterase